MTLSGLNNFLAQQTPPMQQDPTGAGIKMVGMMAFFLVIMWVLMIGPQRKKAKQLEQMMGSMRTGDKIVTNSGIIAVVIAVKEKSLSVRSGDTKLEILKSAVAEITERSSAAVESIS